MATQNAKHCFRRLIRSAKIAFSNDKHALKAARAQLRVEFLKNKHVTDPVELQELFKGVEEIDEVLRFHLVQGTLNNQGNYDVRLSEANMVVVEAGQENPHGPELAAVDTSVLGKPVIVDRVEKPSPKAKT